MARHAVAGPAYTWGAATLFLALAVILTALGTQYIGGYVPCALCLQQRWAYYAGIPATFGPCTRATTEPQAG